MNDKDKIDWSEKEVSELLVTDFSKNEYNTSFLIPLIVFQLRDFHPICAKSTDAERFGKLISLYFKIRRKDVSLLKNKTIVEQLKFIRADYYSQLRDEQLLPYMKYTMDDGPIYGQAPKKITKTKILSFINVDFGKLLITKSNNQIILIAKSKENKTIWARIMTGANSDRYLRDLEFDKDTTERTSLATIVHFYSEGERLNLYLKPSGRFMYYFHSW